MTPTKERKPLSVLIAMDAHRLQHSGEPGEQGGEGKEDEAEGADSRHDDEEMVQAAQDVLDAKTHGDARMLNEALCNWQKLYEAKEGDEGGEPDGDEADDSE